MRIIIAGDLTLQDRSARIKWDERNLQHAFLAVRELIGESDHAIVNLESPVTDCTTPILKDGPTLKNPAVVFDIIRYCGFDIATLANNHLKDYGSQGVMDTIHRCKGHNIVPIGAASRLEVARKPLVLSQHGRDRIGIINVCEHESSIATKNNAGANPLDLVNLYYDIKMLKDQVDKVVVIIHGGREHYQLPTPRMKREYHLLIDYGADVIVNHHQHCYSGYEIYSGKPIFYGLGNFFFDRASKRNNNWNEGLLLQLDIDNDKTDFKLIPYEQCNEKAAVKILDEEKEKYKLEKLNAIIMDDRLLESEFERYVQASKIMSPLLPFGNKVMRSLYYRGLLPSFVSIKNKVLIENTVSCETHREVLLTYLKNQIHNE